jgi:hypothetical protein
MTKMVYGVVRRPKKFDSGRTHVGWKEDGASNAVQFAGYLLTSRTKRGHTRKYTAYLCMSPEGFLGKRIHLGDDFKTRAQAAFAIWREYYKDKKDARRTERKEEKVQRGVRREARLKLKEHRKTPEGLVEYKKLLNAQAVARRTAMTSEQKAVIAAKRKEKRLRLKAAELLEGMIKEGA